MGKKKLDAEVGGIHRRALFTRAASAAATLVVSQSFLSCDSALALG